MRTKPKRKYSDWTIPRLISSPAVRWDFFRCPKPQYPWKSQEDLPQCRRWWHRRNAATKNATWDDSRNKRKTIFPRVNRLNPGQNNVENRKSGLCPTLHTAIIVLIDLKDHSNSGSVFCNAEGGAAEEPKDRGDQVRGSKTASTIVNFGLSAIKERCWWPHSATTTAAAAAPARRWCMTTLATHSGVKRGWCKSYKFVAKYFE